MAATAYPFQGPTFFRQFVFIRKRVDLTTEQFRQYWSEVHGPLIKSLRDFQRYTLRYEQIYPETNGSLSVTSHASSEVVFDGIAVLDYPHKEHYAALSSSNEWASIAATDLSNFADVSSTQRAFVTVQLHASQPLGTSGDRPM